MLSTVLLRGLYALCMGLSTLAHAAAVLIKPSRTEDIAQAFQTLTITNDVVSVTAPVYDHSAPILFDGTVSNNLATGLRPSTRQNPDTRDHQALESAIVKRGSEVPCAAAFNTGALRNGGFEFEFQYWEPRITRGNFWNSVVPGRAYEGCYSYMVLPTSMPEHGDREVTFTNVVRLRRKKDNTLTFYVGRIAGGMKVREAPIVRVHFYTQTLLEHIVCGDEDNPCPLSGVGNTTWEMVTMNFSVREQMHELMFSITWTDMDGNNQPVLFDGLSILPGSDE